jgi:polar amino acid transport system substrate-binding protein
MNSLQPPRHLSEARKRRFGPIVAFSVGLVTLAACGGSSTPAASGANYDLITPGQVTVAISTGNMPYNGLKDGKLTGLDGEIFARAAADLGLTVHPVEIDFTGLLAGVQSRRYDIGIGDVAWRKARADKGLFTDPPFYSPAVAAEKPGLHADSIASLSGLNLGTQDSFFFIDGLKKIPNAHLHLYPSQQALFADLNVGRIDVAFLDPLGMVQAHKLAPDLRFDEVTFQPPTADQLAATPQYGVFLPFMDGWYLNSQEQKFEDALNQEIRKFYANGYEASEVKAWGGNPDVMLKPDPSFVSDRSGVDRPASWKAPSI